MGKPAGLRSCLLSRHRQRKGFAQAETEPACRTCQKLQEGEIDLILLAFVIPARDHQNLETYSTFG